MGEMELQERLLRADRVRRAAGMWVVWRKGRSRGPGKPLAAVLCAGRVRRKVRWRRRALLLTERSDLVRVHEAWLLPRRYPVGELWPQQDGADFLALEMDEARRVLLQICSFV